MFWTLSNMREGHSLKIKWYEPTFAKLADGMHMPCEEASCQMDEF